MNLKLFYPWLRCISSQFPSFTVWQHKRLAIASLGILLAEHCHLAKVARMLSRKDYASTERRLHRCLADKKWTAAQFSRDWIRWVANCLPRNQLVLLVDETSIANRFRIMMVGAAYKRRCIPLIWRCYKASSAADYPGEGQVKMIAAMLGQLKAFMPDDRPVRVLADRGIGTSPSLCRAVETLGWRYLFRVVKTVKIKTDTGKLWPYAEVKKGGRWAASGIVFTAKGRISAHIRVIWEKGCAEPWVLVTNDPTLTGREYAMRNWQEQGFRDLKSGGWQLEACRLRSVEKLSRFLAILALAQGAALALGSLAVLTGKARRLIRTKEGRLRRPLSLFKEGLRFMNRYVLHQDDFQELFEPFLHRP